MPSTNLSYCGPVNSKCLAYLATARTVTSSPMYCMVAMKERIAWSRSHMEA